MAMAASSSRIWRVRRLASEVTLLAGLALAFEATRTLALVLALVLV